MALNRDSCGAFQDLFGVPPDYHTPLGHLKSRAMVFGRPFRTQITSALPPTS